MSAQPSVFSLRPSSRPLRLGFVGLGWIGRKRLDAIAADPSIQVAALSDSDTDKLTNTSTSFPDAKPITHLEDLLSCALDGVVIATPNADHADQAIACLRRGVAVFCQKPLATNAADAERVVQCAQQADKLLSIDFSYRHVRGMHALRDHIQTGSLGEINAIDLVFHNAYGPNKHWCFDRSRAGGGCLLDLGVHLVDLALWLQNGPSMRVVSSRLFSRGRVATKDEVEDLAFLELRQENGAIVRIACSWNAQIGCDAQISAHIQGSRGGAEWRNLNGSFVDFDLHLLRGNARERLGMSLDDWGPGALSAWIGKLRQNASFDPDAFEILAGARLIDEAYR